MKTLLKRKITELALPMLMSFGALVGQAHADIVPGFYEGRFPHYGFNAKIFVYQTGPGTGISLLFGTNEHGSTYGAIFNITELRSGLQSWTQQFRDGSGSMSSEAGQHASYSAKFHWVTEGRNHWEIHLNPTEWGKTIGCTESFAVRRKDDWYATNLPRSKQYKGQNGAKGFIDSKSLSGNVTIAGESFGGEFQILGLGATGLGMIKGEDLDPNKATGVREDMDNMGLIATFRKQDEFLWIDSLASDDMYFFIIRPATVDSVPATIDSRSECIKAANGDRYALSKCANICLAPTAVLKEK
jgi:hypothetical protein